MDTEPDHVSLQVWRELTVSLNVDRELPLFPLRPANGMELSEPQSGSGEKSGGLGKGGHGQHGLLSAPAPERERGARAARETAA